jgi:hypothetical protein
MLAVEFATPQQGQRWVEGWHEGAYHGQGLVTPYGVIADSIRFEEITRVQDAYWKMRSKDAHHTINP